LSATLLELLVLEVGPFFAHVAYVVASYTVVHHVLTEIGIFSNATSSTEEFVTAVI
jgi:hypothetical protein